MMTPEDLVQKQTLLDLQDVTFYEYCEIMNNGTGTPELNALGPQGRDEKIAHLADMFGCSEELTRKAYELIYGK